MIPVLYPNGLQNSPGIGLLIQSIPKTFNRGMDWLQYSDRGCDASRRLVHAGPERRYNDYCHSIGASRDLSSHDRRWELFAQNKRELLCRREDAMDALQRLRMDENAPPDGMAIGSERADWITVCCFRERAVADHACGAAHSFSDGRQRFLLLHGLANRS